MEKKRNHYYQRFINQHLLFSSHPDVQRQQMHWDWRQFCVKRCMHEIYWHTHHILHDALFFVMTRATTRGRTSLRTFRNVISFLKIISIDTINFNPIQCNSISICVVDLNWTKNEETPWYFVITVIHFNESLQVDRKTFIFHESKRDISRKIIKFKCLEKIRRYSI